jgi:hypothetical protein
MAGDDDAFCAPSLPSDRPAQRSVEQEAIAERELFGLAVDRTSVARAIENQHRHGDRALGRFMTPEEQADEEAVDDDLPDQAERILTAAGAELGHTEWRWVSARRCVLITVKGDPAQFRPMFDRWRNGHRILLESATYSREELNALGDRITEELNELEALGIDPSGIAPARDGVEFEYFATDRAEAERVLSSRYGPAVRPTRIGLSRVAEERQPFGSWVSEGTELTIFYPLPHNGEKPGTCTATELEDKIVVTLTILAQQGWQTLIGGYKPSHATVGLSRPVGDRTVIDSAHNAPRPRWRPPTGQS